jgi:hypothetical protein
MANRRKTITLGALAVAVLATVASAIAAWITVLLFVLVAFLMAWGMQPKLTEAGPFAVGKLPPQGIGQIRLDAFRPELRSHTALGALCAAAAIASKRRHMKPKSDTGHRVKIICRGGA